jgi:hypothetical protein
MARFTGTADNGDFNLALSLAIAAAREGLGAELVTWVLSVVRGANGGGAPAPGQNDLTVEIEASAP